MKNPGFLPRGFYTAFMAVWIFYAAISLAGAGLVLYILYRVATHPW